MAMCLSFFFLLVRPQNPYLSVVLINPEKHSGVDLAEWAALLAQFVKSVYRLDAQKVLPLQIAPMLKLSDDTHEMPILKVVQEFPCISLGLG